MEKARARGEQEGQEFKIPRLGPTSLGQGVCVPLRPTGEKGKTNLSGEGPRRLISLIAP